MADEIEKFKKAAGETFRKIEGTVIEKTVSEESKLWAALCYIIVVLFPIAVLLTDKKQDRFVKFHSYQSLVLFAATMVYSILLAIVHFIFGMISKLATLLLIPFYFLPLLVFLLMAYSAYQGKLNKLPFIGEIAEKASR